MKTVDYSPNIALQQVNWIGRKEGLTIDFQVEGADIIISCFTKYPETIFGVSWVVVSPEYPELEKLVTDEQPDLNEFCLRTNQRVYKGLMWEARGNDEAKEKYAKRKVPLRRYGTPEEVAHMTLNLCLPASSFVNGAAIVVDGAMSVKHG